MRVYLISGLEGTVDSCYYSSIRKVLQVGEIMSTGIMSEILVENAKVLPKGQITLPRDVRQSLGLGEGDRVTFILQGDKAIMMNSTIYAMRMLQDAMGGEAESAGIFTEDDVISLISDLHKEAMQH